MSNGILVDVEIWFGSPNCVRHIPNVYKGTINMDKESNKVSFKQKDDRYEEGVSYIFDMTNLGFVVLG